MVIAPLPSPPLTSPNLFPGLSLHASFIHPVPSAQKTVSPSLAPRLPRTILPSNRLPSLPPPSPAQLG